MGKDSLQSQTFMDTHVWLASMELEDAMQHGSRAQGKTPIGFASLLALLVYESTNGGLVVIFYENGLPLFF